MKMLFLTCLMGLAVVVSGYRAVGDFGSVGVVSRRDGDKEALLDKISDTLDAARQGISADDLREAAGKIEELADDYLNATGEAVSLEDGRALINKIAAKLNTSTAVAALFGDSLQQTASIVNAALQILEKLADKFKNREGAGKPTGYVLAAISATANSITKYIKITGDIVAYNKENAEDKTKRVAGVVVSDNRERRAPWYGGLSGGWSPGGGWTFGGSIGYTWK